MTTRKSRLRCRVRPVRLPLVLLAAGLTACSTAAPRQTGFQQSLGSEVTSREIRIRAAGYAMTFSQTVEIAADSILRLTTDRLVARNALVWKSYAVPAIYRSATLPDPLMAWIDSRVLTYQMRDYLETGKGRDLFGEQQWVALEATRFMEGELERAIELSGQKQDTSVEARIREFAAENPLTNPYFFRPSPVEHLARYLGQDQLSGLQAVGGMTELMEDMSQRLNTYSELLPRSGRWQAELMLAELADPQRATIFLDMINQIEALETLNTFLLNTPDLVEEQREILLEAVDQQRIAFEAALETYVAGATDEILAGITPEREAAMAELDRILHAEIEEAVTRLDGSISRAVADIDGALERAVNQLFVRLLQLVAIVGVVALLLVLLLRRRFVPARAE
ncbi:MAG: hypothetical protein HKP01_04515 [Gemmatimonadetes bacterium]|nr:hypothetical protein [Gemmatimonadota bacterium]